MVLKTRLVNKIAREPRVCTNCDNKINIGEIYHHEEGVTGHLHSLVARQFCNNCYTKYGEVILLSKK
jgi:protein-arginine kinase activator protein McsA